MNVPADLDTSKLHLRTLSTVGSEDKVMVFFKDDEKEYAGGVLLYFDSSDVKYTLYTCSGGAWNSFPNGLPEEADKHWVIEKHGFNLIMHCNGKLVLDIMTSSKEVCGREFDDALKMWGRHATRVIFTQVWNEALESYYIGWWLRP